MLDSYSKLSLLLDNKIHKVPILPLWLHASLSDPGGDLNPRLIALRSAAFRFVDRVGFPVQPLGVYPMSTTIQISRLNHAACVLAYPGFGPLLPGLPAGFTTDRLARLWSEPVLSAAEGCERSRRM